MNDFDTSLIDRAIIFAVNAHKGQERRGKNFPYIIHPLEVLSIASTMTDDKYLLAASVLHDVVEDTSVTLKNIKDEFGDLIAFYVDAETNSVNDIDKDNLSWRERKEITIQKIEKGSKEQKMIALADKLSNIRAMRRDYLEIGDKLWEKFHEKNKYEHAWYYHSLLKVFSCLDNLEAYQEFCDNINYLFFDIPFSFEMINDEIIVRGYLSEKPSLELEKTLLDGKNYILNFKNVSDISFAAMRTLLRMRNNGIKFVIKKVNSQILAKFANTGLTNFIPIVEDFKNGSLANMYQSGDGYTSISYFDDDGDKMLKLYAPFIKEDSIEQEKQMAKEVLLLGINTPLSGDILRINDKNAIIFERIKNKISFSRLIADNKDEIEKYAYLFAKAVKDLHNKPCNVSVFPNEDEIMIKKIATSPLKDSTKKSLLNLIDETEKVTTCIHGDLHTGNLILTNNNEVLFIDLPDFAYGSPYYDLGSLYYFAHLNNDKRSNEIFHFDVHTFKIFYDYFISFYFKTNDENEIEQLNLKLKKYAAFRIIYNYSMREWKVNVEEKERLILSLLSD